LVGDDDDDDDDVDDDDDDDDETWIYIAHRHKISNALPTISLERLKLWLNFVHK